MESCRTFTFPSCPATKSWDVSWSADGRRADLPWARAWACPGLPRPAAIASTVQRPVKTSATGPVSPDTLDGGYAQFVVAEADYCLPIPEQYSNVEAAPLLCAGLIGYRALTAAGDARSLGLYGFGAAAHLIAQICRAQGRQVFAFTRPADRAAQDFARQLGVVWAGGSDEAPPGALDAAIIFAPAGALVPAALAATKKGGKVVCAGIHMSDIPSFPYHLLWGERTIQSVANLTRADGAQFVKIAANVKLDVKVEPFALEQANVALNRLRAGRVEGAAVLDIAR